MPLTVRQSGLLDGWLGDWSIVADHSWPLQDTTVLRVRADDSDLVVKASETSHHIGREIQAHTRVLRLIDDPRFPRLLHADATAGLIVTGWVQGVPVESTPAEHDPALYRQAGAALARLHRRPTPSKDYLPATLAKIGRLLAAAGERELLDLSTLATTRRHLAGLHARPVQVRFTHGDYQPRNWLDDNGTLRVIDFGRAAQRPVESDLVRLLNQQLLGARELHDAFFTGYGRPLEAFDSDVLAIENLLQSLGTIVWANTVGDHAFEDDGRAMLQRCLADPPAARPEPGARQPSD